MKSFVRSIRSSQNNYLYVIIAPWDRISVKVMKSRGSSQYCTRSCSKCFVSHILSSVVSSLNPLIIMCKGQLKLLPDCDYSCFPERTFNIRSHPPRAWRPTSAAIACRCSLANCAPWHLFQQTFVPAQV